MDYLLADEVGHVHNARRWGTHLLGGDEAAYRAKVRELREGLDDAGAPFRIPTNQEVLTMPLEAPVRALLEAKNFAHVGTIKKDGSPSVVPVWVHTDGDHVIVNSAEGRAWPTHLERDPRTTVTVMNLENPYEYAQIVGRVAERTHEDADEVIDSLAKKYIGVDEYPFHQPGEQRVTIRIAPEKVFYSNPPG